MPADTDQSVTAAELGEFLGLTARAVSDLGKRGIAIKAGPGRWLLKASVARYCDDLRRQAKGMGGEATVATAAAERGRLAKAQADLVVLQVARQRGELLDAGEVEREWGEILRRVRSAVLAIPNRMCARLPELSVDAAAALQSEARAVLMELAESA